MFLKILLHELDLFYFSLFLKISHNLNEKQSQIYQEKFHGVLLHFLLDFNKIWLKMLFLKVSGIIYSAFLNFSIPCKGHLPGSVEYSFFVSHLLSGRFSF